MKLKPHKRPALSDDDAFFAHDRGLPVGAEDFAEEFIATATSAADAFTEANDELLIEELGGPYLEIDARRESAWFAADGDEEA